MPWVKFSDDWYDDTDLIEAGPLAMLVWPVIVTWCARTLTDGRIHRSQVRRLVDWQQLGAEPEQAIAPLVALGRLQDTADGYLVVANYHKYQPTREKVLADREAERVRKASGRNPGGQRESSAARPDPPVPVPEPATSSSSSSSDSRLPHDLWTTLAGKQCDAAMKRGITVASPRAWKNKAAENARKDHEERALTLVAQYDLSTSQLVDCLLSDSNPTWLNGLRKKEAASG